MKSAQAGKQEKKKKKGITDGEKLKTDKMICPEKAWKIQADPETITSPRELGSAMPLGYNSLGKEESISSC